MFYYELGKWGYWRERNITHGLVARVRMKVAREKWENGC
jgi:hypothetical protein